SLTTPPIWLASTALMVSKSLCSEGSRPAPTSPCRGELVARVHAEGRVDATEHTADGTRIKARVPMALAANLSEFATF
ncbi:hypothetical protein, partial [Mycolicibacterium porcinum]|uniref:hypothetical protein n=1 Tax=Mycolicibacterium porcinum TaxID=39693 RepID=UPI0013F4C2F6